MIAALLLTAGAVGAQTDVAVTMTGKAFAPGHATVLVGERVGWTNQDGIAHTVTAADDSFDSGHLGPGGAYARRFDAPGRIAYRCTLHRFMRGTVDVVALELSPPAQPVRAGATAELSGRAPQPGAVVELERIGAGTVATTTAGDDGRFGFRVGTGAGPARYRARSGALSSGVTEVAVAPEVRLAARRGAHGVSIRVHVVPPQPGGTVVLERHERERFGYVRLLRRGLRLDAFSRARAVVASRRHLRLRARLSKPTGGYARASSGVVVVPREGAAHAGGHH